MSDPLEHFEEELRSYELLEEHREALAKEARDLASRGVEADPVGLILEAGASEARAFLDALEKAAGRKLDVPGFLGLVPRRFAVEILRANCQAALDHLPNGELGKTLPVLIATTGGYRFGTIDYEDS